MKPNYFLYLALLALGMSVFLLHAEVQRLKDLIEQHQLKQGNVFQRLDFGVRTNTRWLIDASSRTGTNKP